jgi:hypothetical protein
MKKSILIFILFYFVFFCTDGLANLWNEIAVSSNVPFPRLYVVSEGKRLFLMQDTPNMSIGYKEFQKYCKPSYVKICTIYLQYYELETGKSFLVGKFYLTSNVPPFSSANPPETLRNNYRIVVGYTSDPQYRYRLIIKQYK